MKTVSHICFGKQNSAGTFVVRVGHSFITERRLLVFTLKCVHTSSANSNQSIVLLLKKEKLRIFSKNYRFSSRFPSTLEKTLHHKQTRISANTSILFFLQEKICYNFSCRRFLIMSIQHVEVGTALPSAGCSTSFSRILSCESFNSLT